MPEVVRHLSF